MKLLLVFTAFVCQLSSNESAETTTAEAESDESTDSSSSGESSETTKTPSKVVIHPIAPRPRPHPPRGQPPHPPQIGARNGPVRPQMAHPGRK